MLLLSETGVRDLIAQAGVHVSYETGRDFVCLCPFHNNRNSPSMTVSRETGVYNCFNPSCGAKGNLTTLLTHTMRISREEAFRLIKTREMSLDDTINMLESQIDSTDDIVEFDSSVIESCRDRLWTPQGKPGLDYMLGRGFNEQTLRHFEIGYSQRQSSVTVPVHSFEGVPMGFIGRSIKGKRFLNSSGLQGRKTVFNSHRAKRYGATLIIVEASFDAMKVHQAGYPNVGALFKGTVTNEQARLVSRSFSEIVIFVDNDNPKDYPQLNEPPGAALSKKLRAIFSPTMLVKKVPFDRYSGHKDATDMSDDEITHALAGADLMLFDTDL